MASQNLPRLYGNVVAGSCGLLRYFAVTARRGPDELFETSGKLALITEACLQGDIDDGGLLQQQAFCLPDANLGQVGVGGQPEAL